jgi:hypothetical protein
MALIAGHSFENLPQGRACSACGQLWVNIAGTTEADEGKLGIAHTGSINATEVREIRDEVERIHGVTIDVARSSRMAA